MQPSSTLFVVVLAAIAACGETLPSEGSGAPDAGASADDGGDSARDGGTPIDASEGGSRPSGAKLYVLGGGTSAGTTDKTLIGTIDDKGITWADGPALAFPVERACAGLVGSRIVLTHGNDGNLSLVGPQVFDFASNAPSWAASTAPSTLRKEAACFGTKAGLYVAGGGNEFSTAQSSSTDFGAFPVSGGPMTWSTGASLPNVVQDASYAISGSHALVLGGYPCTKTASTAAIDADGGLGSWTSAGELATPVYGATASSNGEDVYVVGGIVGETCDVSSRAVTRVKIDPASGTIAARLDEPSAAEAINFAASAVVNGRLYVFGGIIGGINGSPTTRVTSAAIGSDGALGQWRDEAAMPEARARLTVVVH